MNTDFVLIWAKDVQDYIETKQVNYKYLEEWSAKYPDSKIYILVVKSQLGFLGYMMDSWSNPWATRKDAELYASGNNRTFKWYNSKNQRILKRLGKL